MRLLRRNTTEFLYRANMGKSEVIADGRHTGQYEITYGDPVTYRGSIFSPTGAANDQLFGINTPYTHVLLMDNPNAEIAEDGLITWRGAVYEIKAVRPSLNVFAAALRKQTGSQGDAY